MDPSIWWEIWPLSWRNSFFSHIFVKTKSLDWDRALIFRRSVKGNELVTVHGFTSSWWDDLVVPEHFYEKVLKNHIFACIYIYLKKIYSIYILEIKNNIYINNKYNIYYINIWFTNTGDIRSSDNIVQWHSMQWQ